MAIEPRLLLARAKEMRSNPTRMEAEMWKRLRAGRMAGLKWKRQQPLGPFIVDFVCFETKVIVELDGESHDERHDYDRQRDEYFETRGYRLVRFTDVDFWNDIDGCVARVLTACVAATLAPPSP